METQLLEQNPAAGKLVSETSDATLGTTTLAYANGVRVVLKPTTYKSDEVVLSAGRYGGQYLYDEPDHQNAVHLVQTVEAMGYGSLSPTALQRFLSTRRADAGLSFTPYTEEVDARSTRDDIATMLQLVYLKLTAPRLDAPRFGANRTAIEGYLASLWNSPMTQYEDFTMATLSQGHPRAPRVPKATDLARVDPARTVAMHRERFGNASGFTFVLVGSFAVEEVKPLLAQYLGALPATPRPSQFRDVGVRYPTGQIDRTLRAGSDNSAVTIVYSGERPYSAEGVARAQRADRGASAARHRSHPRGAWQRLLTGRPEPVLQDPSGPVPPPVRDWLCARPGAGRGADDRRDRCDAAIEWTHRRGAREGHADVAERVRRAHEDERVLVESAPHPCDGS